MFQARVLEDWEGGNKTFIALCSVLFCSVFLLECDFGVILFVLQVICNPYEYIYIKKLSTCNLFFFIVMQGNYYCAFSFGSLTYWNYRTSIQPSTHPPIYPASNVTFPRFPSHKLLCVWLVHELMSFRKHPVLKKNT